MSDKELYASLTIELFMLKVAKKRMKTAEVNGGKDTTKIILEKIAHEWVERCYARLVQHNLNFDASIAEAKEELSMLNEVTE